MAFHISCGTPHDNELHAIEVLQSSFGPEWVLFTSIPKYISENEIDACLLGPRGMIVVELKSHRGPIYCPLIGDWEGVPEKNPLEQASRGAQLLKQRLAAKDPALQRVFVDYLVLMTNKSCELEVHADLKKDCRVGLLSEAVALVGGRLASARTITLDIRGRIVRAITGEPVPAATETEWQALERPQPQPSKPSVPHNAPDREDRRQAAYEPAGIVQAPVAIVSQRIPNSIYVPRPRHIGIKAVVVVLVLIGISVIVMRQLSGGLPGSQLTQASGLKSPGVTVTGLDKSRNIITSSTEIPPNSTVLIEASYTNAAINRDEMQINVDWSNGSASCDKTLLQSITGTIRCEIDDLKEGFYTVTVVGGKRKLWEVHFNVELPTVRYDGKQIATFRNRELEVTLTNEPDPTGGKRAIAVGKYQNRPAFVLRAELGGTTSALKFLRIDPTSSSSHVVFSSFGKGAHCCTETKFASADVQGNWYVVDGRVIDGEVGYEFNDLDGDGAYELISSDNDFLYAFGCYACSTMPARIEKLVGQKFVNVTRDAKYQKFLREVLKRMEARSDSNSRSNGYLGGWVASKILVGELNDAWGKMLTSYDPASDTKMEECLVNVPLFKCPADQKRELTFPEALLKLLVRNGYVTQRQATLLPTVAPNQPLKLVQENRVVDAVGTAPQPRPDVSYGSRCLPGQISSGTRCLQIPAGAVDFSLDAGDMFTLPAGEVGYLTAVFGGIFVRNSQSTVVEYVAPGKRKLIVSTDIMKAEINGTRAEYRPVQ